MVKLDKNNPEIKMYRQELKLTLISNYVTVSREDHSSTVVSGILFAKESSFTHNIKEFKQGCKSYKTLLMHKVRIPESRKVNTLYEVWYPYKMSHPE